MAAKQIARITAREFLAPLINRCCDRLANVLCRLVEIAMVHVQVRMSLSSDANMQQSLAVTGAPVFQSRVKQVYKEFVDSVSTECRAIAMHHLEVAVSEWMVYSEESESAQLSNQKAEEVQQSDQLFNTSLSCMSVAFCSPALRVIPTY